MMMSNLAMISDGRANMRVPDSYEWGPEHAPLSSATEEVPAQLARLEPALRPLALQRACVLVELGYKKSRALCMAAAFAEEWLEGRRPGEPAVLDCAHYLMCEYDAWLICPADSQEPTHAFDGFEEALQCAHAMAAMSGEALYVYNPAGMLVARYESRGAALDPRRTIHVMPREGGWALKTPGIDHSLACFHDRKDAVEAARGMARGKYVTLVTHYGSDDIQRRMY